MSSRQLLTLGFIAVLGVFASVIAFRLVDGIELERAELAFQRTATERVTAVENRIVAELTIVRSIVALFESAPSVSRDQFSTFVRTAVGDSRVTQALEWIPRVPALERTAYVRAARADGFSEFLLTERSPEGDLTEAGDRPEYFPVYYVVPFVGNEGALGFDLASNPSRLAALAKSRDTGRMVASSRIDLVQATQDPAGILVFLPVYRSDAPRDTIEERRESLAGFALGVFRVSHLIASIFPEESKIKSIPSGATGIDLYLYDLTAEAGKRSLYVHSSRQRSDIAPALDESQARSGPHLEHRIEVGGRTWAMVARPTETDFGKGESLLAWTASIATLLIAGILASYLASTMARARTVERLVDQRTAELRSANQRVRDNEERIRVVVDTIVDGIITIDEHGTVESINPAVERIFGRSKSEIIGHNVNRLIPEPRRSEHDGYIARYVATGESRIIDTVREVAGLRKDGSEFPLDLAVSEMQIGKKRMFSGIVRDVTDRREAEIAKAEFISTVSHELRTPLTSIKGALGLVKSEITGDLPDKFKAMLEIANNNVDRLVRLTDDILDAERLESGKVNVQLRALDISTLVEQAVEANTPYAAQHGVSFVVANAAPDAVVLADEDRFVQILTNLLSNAVKFSAEDEEVEVAVMRGDSGIHISVTDHGPGVPESYRDQVFEKFSQADTSDARQKGGTGLGLSIAKALVERHGGTIGFDTETGIGTTFFVDVPEWTGDPAAQENGSTEA